MNFKSKKNIILRNFVPKWASEKTMHSRENEIAAENDTEKE